MRVGWVILLTVAWFVAPVPAQVEQDPPQDGDQAGKQEGRRGKNGERGKRGDRRRGERGDRRRGDARGIDATIERMKTELDLDADQIKQIDKIVEDFKTQNRESMNDSPRRGLTRRGGDQGPKQGPAGRGGRRSGRVGGGIADRPILKLFDKIEPVLHEDQLAKFEQIKARVAAMGGRDPLAQIDRLKEELNLNSRQEEEWDDAYRALTAALDGSSAPDEVAVLDLVQEMQDAEAAGDTDRADEIRQELRGARPKARDAVGAFYTEIESFLTSGQKEIAQEFRQGRSRRGGRDRGDDPRQYFRVAMQLELDATQREQLRDIRKEAGRATREARGDREATAALANQVKEEIRAILTDEQVARFDRLAESTNRGGRGGPRGKADKPRGGGKDGPRKRNAPAEEPEDG